MRVLDNFSYTFVKGDRVGVVGRNGVGKSTVRPALVSLFQILSTSAFRSRLLPSCSSLPSKLLSISFLSQDKSALFLLSGS